MYPFLRLAINVFKARRKAKFEHPFMVSKIPMKVMPSDIDIFMEMNNGRYLTLMDIGRFDVGARVGLFEILKKNDWGLMVGAVSTRYRNRFRLFQKFTLNTKMLYFDDRWFYFHQWFVGKNGKVHASFLVRTAVTSKNGLVPTTEVVDKMNYSAELIQKHNQPSGWIQKWELSDDIHKQIMEVDLVARS